MGWGADLGPTVPHCQLVSIRQKSQLAVLHFINVNSYVTGAQTAECSPACSRTCMRTASDSTSTIQVPASVCCSEIKPLNTPCCSLHTSLSTDSTLNSHLHWAEEETTIFWNTAEVSSSLPHCVPLDKLRQVAQPGTGPVSLNTALRTRTPTVNLASKWFVGTYVGGKQWRY